MNQTNKAILSFLLLLTIFITNASEELLRHLANEIDPNQAQKKARMFLQRDENKCIELFQQALKEENAVAQLHLANTHFAIKWFRDWKKDFSSKGIKKEQLESYNFASREMRFLQDIYTKINPSLNWGKKQEAARQTINQAAKTGNACAKIIQIFESRFEKSEVTTHFGIACKLKPLLNQEQLFPELLFTFGNSLFNSHFYNPQLGLEGLKYMEQSGLLNLKFFEDVNTTESFEKHCKNFILLIPPNNYFDKYGMRFVKSGTILVPSKKHWEEFKKESLDPIQPSPDNLFDLFEKHDMKTIYNLTKKYTLDFFTGSSKYDLDILHYNKESGKIEELGTIKLTQDESKNTNMNIQLSSQPSQQTIIKKLSPVINFLRDALSRCKDVSAVCAIMEDLEYDPVLNPDRT